jgi:CRISPR/Cas system-associated endoribonuclease Cas2
MLKLKLLNKAKLIIFITIGCLLLLLTEYGCSAKTMTTTTTTATEVAAVAAVEVRKTARQNECALTILKCNYESFKCGYDDEQCQTILRECSYRRYQKSDEEIRNCEQFRLDCVEMRENCSRERAVCREEILKCNYESFIATAAAAATVASSSSSSLYALNNKNNKNNNRNKCNKLAKFCQREMTRIGQSNFNCQMEMLTTSSEHDDDDESETEQQICPHWYDMFIVASYCQSCYQQELDNVDAELKYATMNGQLGDYDWFDRSVFNSLNNRTDCRSVNDYCKREQLKCDQIDDYCHGTVMMKMINKRTAANSNNNSKNKNGFALEYNKQMCNIQLEKCEHVSSHCQANAKKCRHRQNRKTTIKLSPNKSNSIQS